MLQVCAGRGALASPPWHVQSYSQGPHHALYRTLLPEKPLMQRVPCAKLLDISA